MQTEVMRYYGLARPPVDLGFFETEHHAQLTHDLKTAITGGRLIALTATIRSARPCSRADCAKNWSAKGA